MYVLDCKLQARNSIDKWQTRARLAIYLGASMHHALNVGLALSMTTGLVSPAFHAKYDDKFETVSNTYGRYLLKSQWQSRCRFVDKGFKTAPIRNPRDQFYNEQ
jgi:hypothetical protein